MANFALSGPIFKIRNSKQVYSKSYKQLAVCQNIKNSLQPSVAWSRFYSILFLGEWVRKKLNQIELVLKNKE